MLLSICPVEFKGKYLASTYNPRLRVLSTVFHC